MQEQYIPPDLKLAGKTNELVLGSLGPGFDAYGQAMPHGKEFETDEIPPPLEGE